VSTQGRLLVVDDELSVRDSLDKWFREEGYEVGTAENANDALTLLAEHRWDAALVDIKMHGTDGIELQRRMHEIDPELVVIMMTGYASVETAVAALKNGAYDYVTKPLDPDEIAHLIKNALAHKRTAQENVLCARPSPKSRVRKIWSGRAAPCARCSTRLRRLVLPTRPC
jgi:two-component system, NtrC family, response regulator HydG